MQKMKLKYTSELLVVALTYNTFFAYFFGAALFSYPLIFAAILFIVLRLLFDVGYRECLSPGMLLLIPLSVVGLVYVVLGGGSTIDKLSYAIPFLVIPFLYFAASNISRRNPLFINKLIISYVSVELFVVLGQLSMLSFGVGLPFSEGYEGMLTGTHYNSNNLASVICGAAILYSHSSRDSTKVEVGFVWSVLLIIGLLMASRSAIVLLSFIFLFRNKLSVRLALKLLLGVVLVYLLAYLVFLLSEHSVALSRISNRLLTLEKIGEGGISTDNSVSLRVTSYFYFLQNIFSIGLGSAEPGNYSYIFNGATFDHSLMSSNPHSLVVEISYWLGWPGLLALILLLGQVFFLGAKGSLITRVVVFFIFIVASLIPSSVIRLYPFFVFFLLAAVVSKSKKEERSVELISPVDLQKR